MALAAEARAAQQPKVDLSEGKLLVQLAREAMSEYLLHRTPADGQVVPLDMQRLKDRNYRVAVILRSDGRLVGRCVRGDSNMPRNTISAAIVAMRSPLLPDKITAAVLDALTVEVEVLGEPEELTQQDIANNYTPGWTGLAIKSGRGDVILPSHGYESGWDAAQMQAQADQAVGQVAATQGSVYLAFASRHFVGYPGAAVVWLYRGKVLQPSETIDDAAIITAARAVGNYLQVQQAPTGRYCAGGEGGLLVDHLHATYALALLSERTGQKIDLAGALAWAQKQMLSDDDAKFPRADKPSNQMPAAGYYVLACKIANSKPDATAERLLQFLASQIECYVQDRLDRPLTGEEIALGVAALRSAGRLGTKLEQELIEHLKGPNKMDDQSQLWLLWAHLPSKTEIPTLTPADQPEATTRLLDEQGGWPLVGQPQTQTTALWAAILAGQLIQARADNQLTQVNALSEHLRLAKQFCRMMVFKRYEDYFAPSDSALIGAVRNRPGGAQVSLRSCAAAIEAFLAQ